MLRAFAVFAEELNFTHAARRVGLSQPALFERVRRLAEHVGSSLYKKEGRVLSLTPVGVEVAAFAREQLRDGHALLARLQGRAARRPVLAAGEGSYLYVLGPVLAGLDVDLLTLGGPRASDAVLTGRADVAFGSWDVVADPLVATPVLTTPMCAAVREDHPLASGATVTLAKLGRHRLILAPEGQRHRDVVGRAVAAVSGPLLPPVTADGWPLMLAFAAMGQGVAVVNGTCRAPPGVVLRPIPELGTITYSALRRRDRAAGTLHDALCGIPTEEAALKYANATLRTREAPDCRR